MNLAEITQKAWQNNTLLSVLVELTYVCNLDCYFCYNDRGLRGEPLSKDQYFGLLEDLRDMNVLYLVLSGGEPLAHPDFFAIGAKARELGFVTRIKSNGHALNQRLANRLKAEVDPYIIDISLHGATAATHDRQTRVPGSFDKLISNIDTLKKLGLRIQVNGTLTAWNEHELEAMFELADELQLNLRMNSSVSPRDDGDKAPLAIAPSSDAITAIAALYAARAEAVKDGPDQEIELEPEKCETPGKGTKLCGTGSSTLTIDPVGNILPCVQWRRPVGNLHRDSLKDIWGHSPALADIRKTAEKAKSLVDSYGEEGKLMNYCIGEAVCQTGSPLQVYPSALQHLESRIKIVVK